MAAKSELSHGPTPHVALPHRPFPRACGGAAAILATPESCFEESQLPARRKKTPRAYSSPACYAHEPAQDPRAGHGDIQVKRIYEPADPADGYRALVDRLWPRGISRPRAALDNWLLELAPSTELRQWFHNDPRRWPQFVKRYRAELRAQAPMLDAVRKRARQQRVTLLYGARDPRRNHALVLRDVLHRA